MIPISEKLDRVIKSDAQVVKPRVKAWFSDLRFIENASVYSTSESFSRQVLKRDPVMYIDFNELTDTLDATEAGITQYFYDKSGQSLNQYQGSNITFPAPLTVSPTNWEFSDGPTSKVQLYTDRIIDTFDRPDSDTLGFFSGNEFFSWSNNGSNWKIQSNAAEYVAEAYPAYGNLVAVSYFDSQGIDGFVDFKLTSVMAHGAFLHYIDDNNFVMATGDGLDSFILKKKDGIETIVVASGNALDLNKYYRFEVSNDKYTVYDMGITEPTNSSVGTSIMSAVITDKIFRDSNATKVGFGSYNIAYATYGGGCDYFAANMYKRNHASVNFDGTKFTTIRTNSGLEKSTSISRTSFENEFAIHASVKVTADSFPYAIISKSTDVYPDTVHQWRLAVEEGPETGQQRFVFRILNADGEYYSVQSNSIVVNQLYNVLISYYQDTLTMYMNGIEASKLAVGAVDPDGPVLYPSAVIYPSGAQYPTYAGEEALRCMPSTSGDAISSLTIGADVVYDAWGEPNTPHFASAMISEVVIFDTGLSAWEAAALDGSCMSVGTLENEVCDIFHVPEQVIDGSKGETFTWALANQKNQVGNIIPATGEYKAMGTEFSKIGNYGWLSRSKSSSSKDMTTDFIAMQFDPVPVNKIRVTTAFRFGKVSSIYLGYITEDNVENVVEVAIDPDKTYGEYNFNEVNYIKAIKVIPKTLENAYDYARIHSIDPIWEVDISDRIMGININKTKEEMDSTLPIGSTAANTLSLTLDNTDLKLNPFSDSEYAPYITPDTEIFASLAWEIGEEEYEEVKLGDSFFVDTWNVEEGSLTVSPNCRDWSKFAQEENIAGYIGQNITAGEAVSDIMKTIGFPASKINYLKRYDKALMSCDPFIMLRLNETGAEYLNNGSQFHDSYGNASASEYYVSLGNQSIVPSESTSFQNKKVIRPGEVVLSDFQPTFSTGSAYMTPDNGGRVNVSTINNVPMFSNDDWSFSIYVQESSEIPPGSGVNTIVTEWSSECFTLGLLADSEISSSKNRALQLKVKDASSNFHYGLSSSRYSIGQPLQVVSRKIGTLYEVFVNGILEISLDMGALTVSNFGFVCIGHSFEAGYGGGGIQAQYFTYFTRALTNNEIEDLSISGQASAIPIFPYLYAVDTTAWEAMLEFAMADIGMFYFDEHGDFVYEYRNTIHQDTQDRHQVPQYELAEDINIIDGSVSVEVLVNRVTVKINGAGSASQTLSGIWTAEEGESLAVTKLTQQIDANAAIIQVENVDDPLWLESGLAKIDDEIIEYSGISAGSLIRCRRGMFGTSPKAHAVDSLVREARYYNIEYDKEPALAVRFPYITSKDEYDKVDVDSFYADSFHASVLLSANKANSPGDLVILQGEDAVTELKYFFAMSGLVVEENSGKESTTTEAEEIDANIRRYRLKELTIDNKFITIKEYGKLIANFLIDYYSVPVPILNMATHGIPHLQLGDLILITKYTRLGIEDEKYLVIGIDINYDGGIKQDLVLQKFVENKAQTVSIMPFNDILPRMIDYPPFTDPFDGEGPPGVYFPS